MGKIKITEFGHRHFDKDFGGTKILDKTKEQVEKHINKLGICMDKTQKDDFMTSEKSNGIIGVKVHDGYAPFCKLVAVKNFTKARVGSMPITESNHQYIRSGYFARRDSELPMFSRWLDLPVDKPVAEWLVFVLYDKEQIDKEARVEYMGKYEVWASTLTLRDYPMDKDKPIEPESFDAEWGVVAILGQSHPDEEPMKPETMLRNALGIDEGGSGVKLDRTAYFSSVKFWDKNVTVK